MAYLLAMSCIEYTTYVSDINQGVDHMQYTASEFWTLVSHLGSSIIIISHILRQISGYAIPNC
jgi:hypothetical protein